MYGPDYLYYKKSSPFQEFLTGSTVFETKMSRYRKVISREVVPKIGVLSELEYLYNYAQKTTHCTSITHEKVVENFNPQKMLLKRLFAIKGGRYLVNKYFTEGMQKVGPEEVHIYDVTGVLDIYEITDLQNYTANVLPNFLEYEQTARIWNNGRFYVKSNTVYFIIAARATIFRKRISTQRAMYNSRPGIHISSTGGTPVYQIATISQDEAYYRKLQLKMNGSGRHAGNRKSPCNHHAKRHHVKSHHVKRHHAKSHHVKNSVIFNWLLSVAADTSAGNKA